ncbi:MAG: helicase domain protein, partial [Actinomycetia bacterium]|nr:helicase domain protein [Actinomycetes bacterium]
PASAFLWEAALQATPPHALAEIITHSPSESEEAAALRADALRCEAWAGEPFVRPDEDPDVALAPGTARRRALDDALAEINGGRDSPSSEWKVKYALLLGLERVLSEKPPRLASGTELRRHQIDALAGMLTELIAAAQKSGENGNGNGNGNGHAEDVPEEEEEDEELELSPDSETDEEIEEELPVQDDPGAVRRYRFRHPTASGKTIAAAGFVEAARTEGVLILTHRRLLVDQFRRELTDHGYGGRFHDAILEGHTAQRPSNPITIQTYAWFARHVEEIAHDAYELVIFEEAHTALGEKTSAAIRSLSEPIFIGMTATEELIAKQVSDVFPASVDDLPLTDAARRGLIAPLRCLRVPPVAAINQVPIVGGDFEERALAQALDHEALNMAAATLYRERFGDVPGIVYAAGVDHAYNLAMAFRAAGIKAEAVSGRTPPVKLAEILASYERGEIDVLINAMLLAEGWNSPRATVVMHLAPTASKRVYQQRIGRIMRIHPRKEAGIVVDFTPKSATHNERVVSLHSLLDADFYREGARVTPAPRRRQQRRARRKLTPASWLVPVTPDVLRRKVVIAREWQRVDPKFLDEDEQQFWGEIAGRQLRFDERAAFVEKLTARGASKRAMERFLSTCAAENPNRRLRLIALADRVSMKVERADFDDLVTLVAQAPPWEKDRAAGVRILLRAIADGKPDAPDQILARWTWRLSVAVRKQLDRKASQEYPDAKRLLGALANSRGHRHEENAAKLVNAALEMPKEVGAALLASAEGYTPRSTQLLEAARERLGTIQEVAGWIAESLPQPKTGPSRARRRRRRKKKGPDGAMQPGENKQTETAAGQEKSAAAKKRRRRRKKPPEGGSSANGSNAESPPKDANGSTAAPPAKDAPAKPEAPQPAAAEKPAPAARAEDAA